MEGEDVAIAAAPEDGHPQVEDSPMHEEISRPAEAAPIEARPVEVDRPAESGPSKAARWTPVQPNLGLRRPASRAKAGASQPESSPAKTSRASPAGSAQTGPRGPDPRRPDLRRPDLGSSRRPERGGAPTISELLHEGQEILVQIAKEPIAKKGARITSHIALPGRFHRLHADGRTHRRVAQNTQRDRARTVEANRDCVARSRRATGRLYRADGVRGCIPSRNLPTTCVT